MTCVCVCAVNLGADKVDILSVSQLSRSQLLEQANEHFLPLTSTTTAKTFKHVKWDTFKIKANENKNIEIISLIMKLSVSKRNATGASRRHQN